MCRKSAAAPDANGAFPFCSQRCRTVDLGRWFKGEYALNPQTGGLEVIDPDQAEEISVDDSDAPRSGDYSDRS